MAITKDHELHRRRFGRNLGLGLSLGAFVVIVFGLTIVKIENGESMAGFHHGYRPSLVQEQDGGARQ